MGTLELGTHVHLLRLLDNYRMGFLPVLLLIALAWPMARLLRNGGRAETGNRSTLVVLLGAPVLLEHAVLLEYADHDFVALKGGLLLCAWAAWQVEAALAALPRRTTVVRALALGGCMLAGAAYFVRLNPYPGMHGIRYEAQQRMGQLIAERTASDEVVFALGFKPEPQVVWYARRTPMQVASRADAEAFLRERGIARGMLFIRDGGTLHGEPVEASAGRHQ
jgi:hypothetical protein